MPVVESRVGIRPERVLQVVAFLPISDRVPHVPIIGVVIEVKPQNRRLVFVVRFLRTVCSALVIIGELGFERTFFLEDFLDSNQKSQSLIVQIVFAVDVLDQAFSLGYLLFRDAVL